MNRGIFVVNNLYSPIHKTFTKVYQQDFNKADIYQTFKIRFYQLKTEPYIEPIFRSPSRFRTRKTYFKT